LLNARGIEYSNVSSARYAGELRKGVRTHEPARLVDMMVVSAIVEARSCERFERVIPVLDNQLADFYGSLLKSEARHFKIYLDFAEEYAEGAAETGAIDLDARIAFFLAEDQRLVESPDADFRFHSGVPEASLASSSLAAMG
jgi:tRNA-(ms[2]io[6]A)-hydroxylase